jgi:hypothetical protein
MLNTHSISFYDPYRERNRNSALELKKGLPYNKIALSLIRVLSRDPVWAKFVRGVFWQALFSYTFTRQKTRSGYVATVFFLFFRTLKKHIIAEKNRTQKVGSLPPPQPPKGRGSWMSDWHVYPFETGFERWPVASVSGYNLNTTRSGTNLIFFWGVRHTCVFSLRRELQKPIRVGKTVINIRTKTRVRLLNTLVTQCNVPLWKFLWLRSFGQKERWYLSKKTHLSRRAGKSFRFTQSKPLKKNHPDFFKKPYRRFVVVVFFAGKKKLIMRYVFVFILASWLSNKNITGLW